VTATNCLGYAVSYAVQSAGKGRWFWVVWPEGNIHEVFDRPAAHGFEPSKDLADRRAREVSAGLGCFSPRRWQATMATDIRRALTQTREQVATTPGPEFVFGLYGPCLVARKTPRFVYVFESQGDELIDTWLVAGRRLKKTFRLDRPALDAGRPAQRAGRLYEDYYAFPYVGPGPYEDCLGRAPLAVAETVRRWNDHAAVLTAATICRTDCCSGDNMDRERLVLSDMLVEAGLEDDAAVRHVRTCEAGWACYVMAGLLAPGWGRDGRRD
jgi:hypothetical protein